VWKISQINLESQQRGVGSPLLAPVKLMAMLHLCLPIRDGDGVRN
jgi:hypothetical protein